MPLSQVFHGAAAWAKQLEVSWFVAPLYEPQASPPVYAAANTDSYASPGQVKHLMPFLRRNLSYIRREIRSRYKLPTRNVILGEEQECEGIPYRGGSGHRRDHSKKVDLLFKCFKHRAKFYNDAFLSTHFRPLRAQTVVSGAKPGIHSSSGTGIIEDEETMLIVASKRAGLARDATDVNYDRETIHEKWEPTSAPEPSMSPLSCSDESAQNLVQMSTRAVPPRKAHLYDRKPSAKQARGEGKLSAMVFHYLYMDDSGFPSIQVERREDRRCPFCNFNGLTDSGILAHCSDFHGDDLHFRAVHSEDGTLHVSTTSPPNDATSSDQHEQTEHLCDFVFLAKSDSQPSDVPQVSFVKRPLCLAATLEPTVRKKKLKQLEAAGADPSYAEPFIPNDKVPLRQYYHSRTYQPMLQADWDADSDDEVDDSWIHRIGSELLDEFTDVTAPEKAFLKLWNEFIKSHTFISDRSVPIRCLMFVRQNFANLHSNDLRQELLLHLFNLWDFGLISSRHILLCMTEYDDLSRQY